MVELEQLLSQCAPGLENVQLPDPSLLMYYENLQNRTIWIDSEITPLCTEYIKYILKWNREDKDIPIEERKPIKLLFYSYGGDLDMNNALCDYIQMSNTPIYGYNAGVACSAGAYIFLSCHKRFMMPQSYFLLHEGEADNLSGTYRQIVRHIADYSFKVEELKRYLKEHTNIPSDVLNENICDEWYIYADEALKYGLIDGIISNVDEMI